MEQPRLAGVFAVTHSSSSRNLLANPFNCNCQLAWLGDWLRKRKIVTGNPRCQNPDFLRQIPLQDVAFPDFRCEEGDACAPGWLEGRRVRPGQGAGGSWLAPCACPLEEAWAQGMGRDAGS